MLQIKIAIIFAVLGLAFLAAAPAYAEDYYAQGILKSKNVLSGADITDITSFKVDAVIPASTTVAVSFSQDRTVFYSATGTKGAWSPCANGETTLDISGLSWTGPLLFYKLRLTTASSTVTPAVNEVRVLYDGTAVPAATTTQYYAWGTILSENLLSGATVSAVTGFWATSTLPAGTAAQVSFSQDKVNFYSSGGTKGAWDNLADGGEYVDLSGLGWTAASLYYKVKLIAEIDPGVQPSLDEVRAVYTGSAVPPLTGTEYDRYGSLVSADLLTGSAILGGYQYFSYNISSIPYGASVQAQFSQDAVTWYAADGTLWGADTLALGEHTSPTTALSLAGLNWQNSDKFYYKLKFATGPDNNYSPVVASAGLIEGASVAGAPPYQSTPNGGLVGYWSFDNPDIDWSSTTAEILDRSGYGNNGNAISLNTKSAIAGQIGQGLKFDGVDDYVSVADHASLRFGTNDFTVSTWIKIPFGPDLHYWDGIVTKGYNTIAPAHTWGLLRYSLSTNTIQFSAAADAGGIDEVSILSGVLNDGWRHVLIKRNGSTAQMYVDGVYYTQDTTANCDLNTTEPLKLGLSGTRYHNGSMDDVRIYNRALSDAEIAELYRLGAKKMYVSTPTNNVMTDGLVGYWSFDGPDMGTTSAIDRSGNNNTGWLLNGVKKVSGFVGQGLKFDGVDDVVDAGDIALADGTNTITVSAWAKLSSFNNTLGKSIVSKTRSMTGFSGWVINQETTYKFRFYVSDGVDSNYAESGIAYADTDWHHITGVYNGTVVNIYVDGVSADGTPPAYSKTIPDSNRRVCIGNTNGTDSYCNPSSSYYFPGSIDDVRIYNRALSADEVSELYRQTAKKTYFKK